MPWQDRHFRDVEVTAANHPPAFTDDPTNTDQTTTVGGSLVPLKAGDPDGDPYTFILANGAAAGSDVER